MAKTDLTRHCERALWKANDKMGYFGCFEVTVGWYGQEIVDFITYETNGEFRCYEIKTSKADFYSSAKLSFIGDFNYYVMPTELYEELRTYTKKKAIFDGYKEATEDLFDTRIKNKGIGLITVSANGLLTTKIKPKRKRVSLGMKTTLLESMVRSLNREVAKFYKEIPYGEKKKPKVADSVMRNSLGHELLAVGTKVQVYGEEFTILGYDNSVNEEYSDYYLINHNGKNHYIYYRNVKPINT